MATNAAPSDRQHWFSQLDEWNAGERPFREIADWLTGEHGLSFWWAQKLIVEYEQARGLRDPGIRPDGTFSIGASKTVDVPVARLEAAFRDLRARWLPGVELRERGARPGRSVRFDVGASGTRLSVQFATAAGGSQVAVEEQRIADAATAEERKSFWRERLVELKAVMEGEAR